MNPFYEYKQEINQAIIATKERLSLQPKPEIDSESYVVNQLEIQLNDHLSNHYTDVNLPKLSLEPAPPHITADFSANTFELSKILRKDPVTIAAEIKQFLEDNPLDWIETVSLAGAYINFSVDQSLFYGNVLKQLEETKENYGKNNTNKSKVAFIEYSSVNIAKPIGVGHLRSTIIGQALANIYEATGYSVIRDNHLGDWGTQFGTLVAAYKKWGNEEALAQDPINHLKDLYVRYTKESHDDPSLKDEARGYFAKLEAKDPETVALWKQFRDLSEKDFAQTYKKINTSFDLQIGESYFEDQMKDIVSICLQKGVAKQEADGSVIVENLDDLPTFLLQKQDGSSLYITRDLASLRFRLETFSPNSLVYVVGNEQELHFRQLFAVAQKLGWIKDGIIAKHIGFGLVLTDGKKMSTRHGTIVELNSLIEKAINEAKSMLTSKNQDLSPQEIATTAEIIGIGAILYNDLKQSRIKNISFDWDRMLNIEGGSAVYLQYTYARIKSILRQANARAVPAQYTFTEPSEFALAKKLSFFPRIIEQAQSNDAPHSIAVYLEELAQLFNSFYNDVPVLKTEDQNLRDSRLQLIDAVATTIKAGLSLLNIRVPERM